MPDDVLKAVAKVVAKHQVGPSDLVGWYGLCSCDGGGRMPIDFETEEDYHEHLQKALRDMGLGEYVRTAEAAVELVRKTIEELDNRGPSLAEAEKVLADVRTAKQRVLSVSPNVERHPGINELALMLRPEFKRAYAAGQAAQPLQREVLERICKTTGGIKTTDDEGNQLNEAQLEAKIVSWGKAGWNEYERLRKRAAAPLQPQLEELRKLSEAATAENRIPGVYTGKASQAFKSACVEFVRKRLHPSEEKS